MKRAKKSNMSKDFAAKDDSLRTCMADGGMVGVAKNALGNRAAVVDAAVNGAVQGAPAAPQAPVPAPALMPAVVQPTTADEAVARMNALKAKQAAPAPAPAAAPSLLQRARASLGLRDGGQVKGPGGPTDDKVPAMLSHGEYVLPADTVQHVGKQALDNLKDATHTPVASKGPRHFANGTPDDNTNGSLRTGQITTAAPGSIAYSGATNTRPQLPGTDFIPTPSPSFVANTAGLKATPSGPIDPKAPTAGDATQPGQDISALRTAAMSRTVPDTGGQIQQLGSNMFVGKGNGDQDLETRRAQDRFLREKQEMDTNDAASAANRNAGMAQNAAWANQWVKQNQSSTNTADLFAAHGHNGYGGARQRALDVEQQKNITNNATLQRGQDMTSHTASNEQGVQTRGQDLTYSSNAALRNLEAAKFGRQVQQQDRQFGLDSQKETRAGRQEGYTNLQNAITSAATERNALGATSVNPETTKMLNDKIGYTLQQMGIHPGDVPPELYPEMVRRAGEISDREEAAKGITGWLNQKLGLAVNEETRDLRNVNPVGFKPGATVDTVQTPTGPITRRDYEYGGPSKSGYTNLNALPNHERKQDLEDLMKKSRLRNPRE